MAISTFMYIIFGATIAYLIVIGIITLGWNLLSGQKIIENHCNPFVSVVIAVKNESKHIGILLEQIKNQTYNKYNFEVIIVNDNSGDNTVEIITAFAEEEPGINISVIESSGNGKKDAVIQGIKAASGDIILTTDGDCNILPYWLSTMVRYLFSGKKVITGLVVYQKGTTLLKKFYELDFLSLVASGAGSIGAGLPLMGNAANMGFYKEDYLNLMIGNSTNKYISGDDVFFIHEIYKKYGQKAVGFVKDEDAVVSTNPPENFNSFINQRTRWASKTRGYSVLWAVTVAIVVFLYNMLLTVFLGLCFFIPVLFPVFLILIIAKFVIDLPLLSSAISFTKKTHLKGLMLISEFVYPIYIVIAAIKSFTGKVSWKK